MFLDPCGFRAVESPLELCLLGSCSYVEMAAALHRMQEDQFTFEIDADLVGSNSASRLDALERPENDIRHDSPLPRHECGPGVSLGSPGRRGRWRFSTTC